MPFINLVSFVDVDEEGNVVPVDLIINDGMIYTSKDEAVSDLVEVSLPRTVKEIHYYVASVQLVTEVEITKTPFELKYEN
jgi:acetaldehyde dehydrogenase (acetylating)